jgi:hypothetical protein
MCGQTEKATRQPEVAAATEGSKYLRWKANARILRYAQNDDGYALRMTIVIGRNDDLYTV